MKTNIKSEKYPINGCLQLNINVNPNKQNNNVSVPQQSTESWSIQINININTNNLQESSSLVNLEKFVDPCQQTNDVQFEFHQESQRSTDLTGSDETDKHNQRDTENKRNSFEMKHNDETKDNSHVDNNNETMDKLPPNLGETEMGINENERKIDTEKPTEATKEIDLISSNKPECNSSCEHKSYLNGQSDGINSKSSSEEKCDSKSDESKENVRKEGNSDNIESQVRDRKYQNADNNNGSSSLNDSENSPNVTENDNQNTQFNNQNKNENEQVPPQINADEGIVTKCDEHQKPGGLYNSKSTCYMNAMIQALSSSNVLIKTLEEYILKESHSKLSLSLLCDLLKALNEENINNEIIKINTNLLEDLIESVGWTKPSQQDAFELLSALFSDIYEKSNNNDEKEIPLRIKLLHEFQGMSTRNRVQEYLGLSLNLCGDFTKSPGVYLEFLINQHFVSTTIDDDDSKLTRLSLYKEIPNILLIHIQANKLDPDSRQLIKPTYYIQYDEEMTLWFDIVNEMNREKQNLKEERLFNTKVEYHLKSVVYHAGNISGGHYVTYRRWRNEWYLADDESIKKEPLNKTISPYIMIYEKSL